MRITGEGQCNDVDTSIGFCIQILNSEDVRYTPLNSGDYVDCVWDHYWRTRQVAFLITTSDLRPIKQGEIGLNVTCCDALTVLVRLTALWASFISQDFVWLANRMWEVITGYFLVYIALWVIYAVPRIYTTEAQYDVFSCYRYQIQSWACHWSLKRLNSINRIMNSIKFVKTFEFAASGRCNKMIRDTEMIHVSAIWWWSQKIKHICQIKWDITWDRSMRGKTYESLPSDTNMASAVI